MCRWPLTLAQLYHVACAALFAPADTLNCLPSSCVSHPVAPHAVSRSAARTAVHCVTVSFVLLAMFLCFRLITISQRENKITQFVWKISLWRWELVVWFIIVFHAGFCTFFRWTFRVDDDTRESYAPLCRSLDTPVQMRSSCKFDCYTQTRDGERRVKDRRPLSMRKFLHNAIWIIQMRCNTMLVMIHFYVDYRDVFIWRRQKSKWMPVSHGNDGSTARNDIKIELFCWTFWWKMYPLNVLIWFY